MSITEDGNFDSREELLAGLALHDLTDDESKELGDTPNSAELATLQTLEAAVAALQIAMLGQTDVELPTPLREKIVSEGARMVQRKRATPQAEPRGYRPAVHRYQEFSEAVRKPAAGFPSRRREILAWCACAAAIVLAAVVWQFRGPVAERPLAAVQARSKLIAEAVDLLQVAWADGKTPLAGKVTGDVVWSNAKQAGFMRFFNLPINDPTKEQYQLWIIDPERDDEPIDGGVFDVTSAGETIVAIQAKLKVLKPAAFAITIEKPGGVVVSTQEKLPLLAVIKEG